MSLLFSYTSVLLVEPEGIVAIQYDNHSFAEFVVCKQYVEKSIKLTIRTIANFITKVVVYIGTLEASLSTSAQTSHVLVCKY